MSRRKKKISGEVNEPDYTIYTDGGCARNPGGPGGIGVIVIDNKTGEEKEYSKGYFATTNNRMEIMAIMEGLSYTEEGASIKLFSDSQYALNCLAGVWERQKNTDLWEQLLPVYKARNVELIWVRGHDRNRKNERCDELAMEAMQRYGKIPDKGFEKQKEEGRAFYREVDKHIQSGKGGAMSVVIEIPEELHDLEPEFVSKREYETLYHVKYECAKTICDFYNFGDRGFKSYIPLKTGGIDSYSRKKAEEIAQKSPNPELYLKTIRKYFDNEKDVNSVARWNARGLSLADSIRKVLVDAEIRHNAIGKR